MLRFAGYALATVSLIMLGALANAIGIIRFNPLWFLPDVTTIEVELATPEAPRITDIEPISLACQARVYAEVPVTGTREHQLLGRTYRTDTLSMLAAGDVDTCVHGDGVSIDYHDDGSADVVIDAASIELVRPRVDAVRTAASVDVDKGAIGHLTDAFPWVDDNLGLTPNAYAYAQNVIGGSSCSQMAWTLTEELVTEGYRDQVIAQDLDPDLLTVTIEGEPTFPEPPPLVLDGAVMSTGTVACSADGVGTASVRQ